MWPKIVDYDNNKHTCLGVNKKDTWHAIGLRWLTSMYRCITNCKLWSFICENSEECANFFQTFVLVCCIQFKTQTTVCTPHPAHAVIEYVQISLFHNSHVTHSKHTNNRITSTIVPHCALALNLVPVDQWVVFLGVLCARQENVLTDMLWK